MDEVGQPTLAFVGHQVEVAFLKSLLEGAGIACSVDFPVWGETGVRDARLFVAHTDREAAGELVADFRRNGTYSKI
jgi:hypothetical protein